MKNEEMKAALDRANNALVERISLPPLTHADCDRIEADKMGAAE